MAETKLNPQQLEAITHPAGPLLIIAGAGTGKTTVITERVKWLIAEGLAQPEEILSLTFTEKSATEMEERIDRALPYGFTQMWVMTFHSFCDRILRDEAIHIGLDSSYHLLTETDSISLFQKYLFEFKLNYFLPLGNPRRFIDGLLTHFSRLQDEDVTPADYLKWANGLTGDDKPKYQELSQVYHDYSLLKIKNGFMDFADLITNTLKLFRDRPNILREYRTRFKYILVDEFQDTNFAQNQLVNLLAGENSNLTVVADDDQSIYRWRGAAVSNVIQFKKAYPAAKLVVLTTNYRSSQSILDASYALIQHNNPDRLEIKEKIDKKLHSVRKNQAPGVVFQHFNRGEDEADFVAQKIVELVKDSDLDYRDFAILVRANAHSEIFTRALARNNLPYQFLGPGRLFHQPEIKDLIAYLKVLNNSDDDSAFYRVLAMEFFNFPSQDLSLLTNFAHKYHFHFYYAALIASGFLQDLVNYSLIVPILSPSGRKTLFQLVELIKKHQHLLPQDTAGQILYDFLTDSGLIESILNYQAPLDEKRAGNIMKFFNKLKSFESNHLDASVPAIVSWLDLSAEVGESPLATDIDWSENNAVNLLTIHSAKGLEFPVVFLVNLVSQRFPSLTRAEQVPVPPELIKEILPAGDFHLQEERRLCYVGATRAKDYLFLTAADFYGDAKRAKKISPFVAELVGENLASVSPPPSPSQPSLLDWQKVTSPVSDHPTAPYKVDYLSYSQIQTFIDCPLHYKAKYILKIPGVPSAASSFGNTMHLTLKDYFALRKQGESPDVQALFVKNWQPEGYLDPKHSEIYFAKGRRFLAEFIASEFGEILPAKLEQPFMVNLNGLKIGGKIDRVDLLPDGRIEIIDYKTSAKSLTPKQAQDDLQLSFYALAGTMLTQAPFNRRPEDVVLSLYYFETGQKVTTSRTADQLESSRQQIYDYQKQIETSDFKCNRSFICDKCDFKLLCDLSNSD